MAVWAVLTGVGLVASFGLPEFYQRLLTILDLIFHPTEERLNWLAPEVGTTERFLARVAIPLTPFVPPSGQLRDFVSICGPSCLHPSCRAWELTSVVSQETFAPTSEPMSPQVVKLLSYGSDLLQIIMNRDGISDRTPAKYAPDKISANSEFRYYALQALLLDVAKDYAERKGAESSRKELHKRLQARARA